MWWLTERQEDLLDGCGLGDEGDDAHAGAAVGTDQRQRRQQPGQQHRPQITRWRAESIASILIELVCLRGHLPQGAPTSPILSNLYFKPLDQELKELAAVHGCVYTRYPDDMYFSTPYEDFSDALAYKEPAETKAVVGWEIEHLLNEHGFSVNQQKTRLSKEHQRQMVIGLIVNDRLNVPKPTLEKFEPLYITGKYLD